MTVSLQRFIDNLGHSGLFSAEELTAFQESLPPEDEHHWTVLGELRLLVMAWPTAPVMFRPLTPVDFPDHDKPA